MVRAEQLTDPVAEHAEGPVWWQPWGGLKYVDMMRGDVLSLHDDGTIDRAHVGTVAAALRPRVAGGAIIAVERSFALAERDDLADAAALPEVWSDTSIRFNDGGCDPQGRFYCGTMAYDEQPGAGTMYRLTASPAGDQRIDRLWGDVTISNGFAFAPDGARAYYNDTPTRRTDVFDYDPETGLRDRRPLVVLPDGPGSPDGLCVDAEGRVWVALWGGSAVHCYSTSGDLEEVVELPVTQVSACTFGGPDLQTLFITTSHSNLPPGEQRQAGSVFSVRPGVTGLPTLPFAG